MAATVVVQALVPAASKSYAAPAAASLQLDVKAAILMDAATGQVLYENEADTPRPPASMAKMMTEYLVMEQVKNGQMKWDDMVTTTQYAADIGGSGGLLAYQEQQSVRSMFEAMSIYSANDASIALAEHIAGSEEEFAKKMNETARKMGLSESAHFINATGLDRVDMEEAGKPPETLEGETMMTARDAATIAYYILKDHPEVLEFTSIPTKKFRETDETPMTNWNWMLEGKASSTYQKQFAYPGMDGLKTGSTDNAGYCFTGTAERNGLRLISVVMGTTAEAKRFEETRKLMDYGFNNFEKKQIVAAGTEIELLPTVDIRKGVDTKVALVTEKDFSLVVKKGAKVEDFAKTAEPVDASKLVAPIKKGDVLGKLTVTVDNEKYEVNLVAKEDVKKGSWIRLFFRSIKNFFSDLFGSIKNLF